jgi:hypothetical protein
LDFGFLGTFDWQSGLQDLSEDIILDFDQLEARNIIFLIGEILFDRTEHRLLLANIKRSKFDFVGKLVSHDLQEII